MLYKAVYASKGQVDSLQWPLYSIDSIFLILSYIWSCNPFQNKSEKWKKMCV